MPYVDVSVCSLRLVIGCHAPAICMTEESSTDFFVLHAFTAALYNAHTPNSDEQLRQLQLIEAEVVARALPSDHVAFNLPRQGRTLTLTNMFKVSNKKLYYTASTAISSCVLLRLNCSQEGCASGYHVVLF
jgi:hypothetical protein